MPEPVNEIFAETSELKVITPASIPSTPTPSLEEEEEDDEFDDGSDEFSFYKFSILHFQSNHGHTHFNERIKQSLLSHDDEGDVMVSGHRVKRSSFLTLKISIFCQSSLTVSPLIFFLQACRTVFWIILRYMEDWPEPKSVDALSQVSSTTMSRHLPHRQARRLSHLVGLDQVTYNKQLLFC